MAWSLACRRGRSHLAEIFKCGVLGDECRRRERESVLGDGIDESVQAAESRANDMLLGRLSKTWDGHDIFIPLFLDCNWS
jgi:hypothetical protein